MTKGYLKSATQMLALGGSALALTGCARTSVGDGDGSGFYDTMLWNDAERDQKVNVDVDVERSDRPSRPVRPARPVPPIAGPGSADTAERAAKTTSPLPSMAQPGDGPDDDCITGNPARGKRHWKTPMRKHPSQSG